MSRTADLRARAAAKDGRIVERDDCVGAAVDDVCSRCGRRRPTIATAADRKNRANNYFLKQKITLRQTRTAEQNSDLGRKERLEKTTISSQPLSNLTRFRQVTRTDLHLCEKIHECENAILQMRSRNFIVKYQTRNLIVQVLAKTNKS